MQERSPWLRAQHVARWASTVALTSIWAIICGPQCGSNDDVGADASVDANVDHDAERQIIWSYGGSDDVLSVAQAPTGTLYVAVRHANDGALDGVFVAALTRDGAELWRTPLAETGAPVALTVNHAGAVWAQGLLLARLDATGAPLWTKALPVWDYGEIRATALAPDGTYYHFTSAPPFQLALEAVGTDGSTRWSAAVGGNTNGADLQHRTIFQAPVVNSSEIEVSCQPCTNGLSGIARLALDTGVLRGVVTMDSDAQPPTVCDGVVADNQGNFYFGASGGLASGNVNGLRWTSAHPGPALVGVAGLVAQGLTELSLADGSVVKAVSLPDGAAVGATTVLLHSNERLVDAVFIPSGSSFGATHGTLMTNEDGDAQWSDPTMDATTAIPDDGRVYGIERDVNGRGTLVAVSAPTSGLEQSAWPMLGHDPGHTNSVAMTW